MLDYTSLLGGEPANLTSDQIIESWKGILTGFDSTHHQLGNYQIETDQNVIWVFCYVTASHYLKNDSGNNTWTVVGSYNIELREKDRKIRITKLKCNLKYAEGNSALGKIAQERMDRHKA